MESEKPQGEQGSKPKIAITALTIILGASSFDPAHINPDFLRHNGIVNSDWQVEYPVIIESGFSLIKYANGLSVTAGRDSLAVSQIGSSLAPEETVVPEVVNRYLSVAPWPVEYQHIHTDLIGSISIAGDGFEPRLSPFDDLSQRVQLGGVIPIIQARAAYLFPDKSTTMYISESRNEGAITGLRFSAHIHRDINSDVSREERDEFIKSTLKKWNDDTRHFDELACQFYFTYIPKED